MLPMYSERGELLLSPEWPDHNNLSAFLMTHIAPDIREPLRSAVYILSGFFLLPLSWFLDHESFSPGRQPLLRPDIQPYPSPELKPGEPHLAARTVSNIVLPLTIRASSRALL